MWWENYKSAHNHHDHVLNFFLLSFWIAPFLSIYIHLDHQSIQLKLAKDKWRRKVNQGGLVLPDSLAVHHRGQQAPVQASWQPKASPPKKALTVTWGSLSGLRIYFNPRKYNGKISRSVEKWIKGKSCLSSEARKKVCPSIAMPKSFITCPDCR